MNAHATPTHQNRLSAMCPLLSPEQAHHKATPNRSAMTAAAGTAGCHTVRAPTDTARATTSAAFLTPFATCSFCRRGPVAIMLLSGHHEAVLEQRMIGGSAPSTSRYLRAWIECFCRPDDQPLLAARRHR